jgi:hypothetical protein
LISPIDADCCSRNATRIADVPGRQKRVKSSHFVAEQRNVALCVACYLTLSGTRPRRSGFTPQPPCEDRCLLPEVKATCQSA